MSLALQVLDAIKAGAITRDLLHQKFPRVSEDAIDIKVVFLRKQRFIEENDVGRLAYIVPLIDPNRDQQLEVVADPQPDPPAPVVSRTSQIQPRQAAAMPPVPNEERTMATKVCSRCEKRKPESEFYNNQGRCKPCFNIIQKEGKERRAAAAGKPAQEVARRPRADPPPHISERRNVKGPKATVARSNGALVIPAGTEIQAEVLHDQGVVRFVEIRSRDLSPGDAADRTWHAVKMDLYQAKRLHAWLAEALVE